MRIKQCTLLKAKGNSMSGHVRQGTGASFGMVWAGDAPGAPFDSGRLILDGHNHSARQVVEAEIKGARDTVKHNSKARNKSGILFVSVSLGLNMPKETITVEILSPSLELKYSHSSTVAQHVLLPLFPESLDSDSVKTS